MELKPDQNQSPREVGDLFSPVFRVKFYAPVRPPVLTSKRSQGRISASQRERILVEQNEKEVTLKLQDQSDLDSLGLDNYASNLSIQFYPGSAQMTLTLTPPYKDALAIMESNKIIMGASVGVTWGYSNGAIAPERLFTICQPSVSFGRDITFTIIGVDTFSYAMRQMVSHTNWDRKVYKKDINLLAELARRCNYTLDISASATLFGIAIRSPEEVVSSAAVTATGVPIIGLPLVTPNPHSVNIKKDTPIEQAKSDWDLFVQICKGNNLLFQIGEGRNIELYDRRDTSGKPPDYKFMWYQQPEGPRDIPMISFTTNPLPTIFLPNLFVNQCITSFDHDTGKVKFQIPDPSNDPNHTTQGNAKVNNTVSGTSDKKGEKTKTEGSEIIAKPKMIDQDGIQSWFGMYSSVPNNGSNMFNKHVGEGRDAAYLANTTATIVAPGHPDVLPPMNIGVEGVGPLFEGAYYLVSARHSLGQQGYEMTLEVLKTTTDGGPSHQEGTKPSPETPPGPPKSTLRADREQG